MGVTVQITGMTKPSTMRNSFYESSRVEGGMLNEGRIIQQPKKHEHVLTDYLNEISRKSLREL